ncbi:hypothetical protein Ddc_20544 [Ditylenchus destructor]|nr:hypothetical protein Ddc_20544 [Ditylenchus destructor]
MTRSCSRTSRARRRRGAGHGARRHVADRARAASAPRAAAPRQPAPQQRQAAPQRPDPQPRQALKQRLSGAPAGRDGRDAREPGFGASDYVRERMLKRRAAEINGQPHPMMDEPAPARLSQSQQMAESVASMAAQRDQRARSAMQTLGARRVDERGYDQQAAAAPAPRVVPPRHRRRLRRRASAERHAVDPPRGGDDDRAPRHEGMIEERFGALAFMEKLQRQPAQARLTQKLLDAGFSPALVRKLSRACPRR